MNRLHNTNKKHLKRVIKKVSKNQIPHWFGPHPLKPYGIWYSIDNEWLDWCRSEMPHWIGSYQHIFNIDLSRILVLKSVEDVLAFNNKYKLPLKGATSLHFIDWVAVRHEWAGIEIQNYHEIKWADRVSFVDLGVWFSAWDVSSGCIWDMSALKGYYPKVTPRTWREARQKKSYEKRMRHSMRKTLREFKRNRG